MQKTCARRRGSERIARDAKNALLPDHDRLALRLAGLQAGDLGVLDKVQLLYQQAAEAGPAGHGRASGRVEKGASVPLGGRGSARARAPRNAPRKNLHGEAPSHTTELILDVVLVDERLAIARDPARPDAWDKGANDAARHAVVALRSSRHVAGGAARAKRDVAAGVHAARRGAALGELRGWRIAAHKQRFVMRVVHARRK